MDTHANHRLVDENMKHKLNEYFVSKQTFVNLLFPYAPENVDDSILEPKA